MTIYDIARQAGLSVATVSRVLNGSSTVKKETRERVQQIIKENNFAPSAVARSLSISDNYNIGVVVPDIENPFFSCVLSGVADTADRYGYNVFLFGTNESTEREHRFLQTIKEQRLKGLIIIPVSENDMETRDRLVELNGNHVPVVLIDRDVKSAKFDRVFSEDETGAYQAVSELVRVGHRSIAIVAGPKTSKPGRQRFEGYARALAEHGISVTEDYIQNGEFRQNAAYDAMKRLMSLDRPPTAVFPCNNLMTLGCLQYLSEKHLVIGEDISMISFDDIEIFKYSNLNLSAVDRPVFKMGAEAMSLLCTRLQSNGADIGVRHRISVETNLILRGSEKLGKGILYDGNKADV